MHNRHITTKTVRSEGPGENHLLPMMNFAVTAYQALQNQRLELPNETRVLKYGRVGEDGLEPFQLLDDQILLI